MAQCFYCGTDTTLHENNQPVCVECAGLPSDRRSVRAKLLHDWSQAVIRADSANQAFMEVTTRIPSGMPHSDGTQRIKSVSRQLSLARAELIAAHDRLSKFVERGIIPDDFKQHPE